MQDCEIKINDEIDMKFLQEEEEKYGPRRRKTNEEMRTLLQKDIQENGEYEFIPNQEEAFRRGFRQGFSVGRKKPEITEDQVRNWNGDRRTRVGPPGTLLDGKRLGNAQLQPAPCCCGECYSKMKS